MTKRFPNIAAIVIALAAIVGGCGGGGSSQVAESAGHEERTAAAEQEAQRKSQNQKQEELAAEVRDQERRAHKQQQKKKAEKEARQEAEKREAEERKEREAREKRKKEKAEADSGVATITAEEFHWFKGKDAGNWEIAYSICAITPEKQLAKEFHTEQNFAAIGHAYGSEYREPFNIAAEQGCMAALIDSEAERDAAFKMMEANE